MTIQPQIIGDKQQHRSEPSQSTKRKALVMDHDPTVLLLLIQMLGTSGYHTEWARHGDEVIEKFRQAKEMNAPFDVVLLDLHVPVGKGGRETVEHLLAIDSNVKAIVSSADVYHPVVTDFTRYGFKAALRKPFTLIQLSHILKGVAAQE